MPSPILKRAALLVAVAAAPVPFLAFGHVAERGNLLWWFLSDLAVAIVAFRAGTRSIDAAPRADRWAFRARANGPPSRGAVGR